MNTIAGKISIDFRSNEPIYLQIARQIEQLVARGELRLGDQLPTVRELATELRINFNTVTRAYRVLDEARLISTQRGRGTYIWEEPTPAVRQELRQKALDALAWQFLRDSQALGFPPLEALERLQDLIRAGAHSLPDEDMDSNGR